MSADEDHENGSNGMNGSPVGDGSDAPPLDEKERALLAAPPPAAVLDLAEACIRFVERAVGVKLDFTVETLPLLDHYVAGARDVLRGRARAEEGEPVDLVAQAAGAYLGEVMRRRYPSWWRVGGEGVDHRLEFHRLYLVVQPVALIHEALVVDAEKGVQDLGGFDMDEDDKEAAMTRLAELPEVPFEEFVAPSTRVEVLDIVIDAARVLHMQAGRPLALEPSDYVH
ncbi:MAG: hypothetical protein JNK04_17305 [Myxococcales bacterium]|nr:hypothetical protein [Myxococcales bacterium]